ncbi:hypothetical protein HNQ94_001171 [Salirhabdus euzebyi]|uniref:Uncharacterized protein n=1 Tax=Salirhabdus euzebyi TaxID=394506 RepID=A0A841Q2K5_9BACI|nr:hypothetical protein [Salirhabdus euzebyi]MBB6452725.1 hypothetical protein [Salirhabdus euzebyi]
MDKTNVNESVREKGGYAQTDNKMPKVVKDTYFGTGKKDRNKDNK